MINKQPPRTRIVQPQIAAPQLKKLPVAPPVYRPQPVPKVLQRKVAGPQPSARPAQPKRPPVAPPVYRPQPVPKVLQPKAAPRPAPVFRNARSVVQRFITINDYNGEKVVFRQPFAALTEELIKTIKDTPNSKARVGRGWQGALRENYIRPHSEQGPFANVNALIKALAKDHPPPTQKRLQKNEERRVLKRKHDEQLKKVNTKVANKGKRIRRVSYKGGKKYNDEYAKTQHHKTNVTNLENTFRPTNKGQVHDLTTGNEFQSVYAMKTANLPPNTKGTKLENVYMPTHVSPFPPIPTRTVPFEMVDDRLRLTTASDDGSYKTGEESNSSMLVALELTRLEEDNLPTLMRHELVQHNVLSRNYEHDPIGKFALYEVPKANKPNNQLNSLVDQNTWNTYEEIQKVPNFQNIELGLNVNSLPPTTKRATVGSFVTAMNEYEKNPNKETQNNLTKQGFYAQRGNMGFHCDTPPGSPFHGEY